MLVARALYIDRFGNVQLDASHEDLGRCGIKLGRRIEVHPPTRDACSAHYVRTFADVDRGELLVYEDASRALAVAVAHGDAAAELGIGRDDELRIVAA